MSDRPLTFHFRSRGDLRLAVATALLLTGLVSVPTLAASPPAAPAIMWSRLISGTPTTSNPVVTSDPQGNVYVAGSYATAASTSDGQVAGTSPQSRPGGADDLFIAKINQAGKVAWLRDVGSVSLVEDIARLSDGRIAVVASTDAQAFPGTPPGSGHAVPGLLDAVLAVFDPDDGGLLWARYIGGPSRDDGLGVVAGPNGSVIAVGGTTVSANPMVPDVDTERPASTQNAKESGFLASFSREGERQWMTVLSPTRKVSAAEAQAGHENDMVFSSVAVDRTGRLFVAGSTLTPNLPASPNAAQPRAVRGSGRQGFVAAYTPTGKRLWLSFLGGNGRTSPLALAVAPDGRHVTVVGETSAVDFRQVAPVRRGCGGREQAGGFVATFTADGRRIAQSACFGADVTSPPVVTYRPDGTLVFGGWTTDRAFPLVRGLRVPHAPKQAVVVTIDPRGRLRTSSRLGGSVLEELHGLTVLPGGDLVASGYTCSPDFPGQRDPSPLDQPVLTAGMCQRISAFVTRLRGF